jgi:hypothetical protein
VEISFNPVDEELPAIVLAVNYTFRFDSWSDVVHDSVNIFGCKQVCNFSR